MPTKVMKEGRITIPKWVRDHLGIESGTEVAFRLAADGSVIIERVDGTRPPSRFAELVGIAGRADAWRGPVGQWAVIASEAKQSILSLRLHGLLRFARNDGCYG